MEVLKKGTRKARKIALVLCNILLMLATVLFTVYYSRNAKSAQETLMRENFCNTVDTMRQISEHYLSGELSSADSWAAYIQQEHMTLDEALDYIRAVSSQEECEAHFVDMATFEAWSTDSSNGSNTVGIYRRYFEESGVTVDDYITRMRRMFVGEKTVLGKYMLQESQRTVISLGRAVTLRQDDGSDRDYLLLRVMPIDTMKKLWLFPVNFSAAEIGLIDDRGWYVIPSNAMRSENFVEFVRYYNFSDDFFGADEVLAQLKEQSSGLLELLNSKEQDSFWYYSRLDGFEGLDILGYIPADALVSDTDNVSVVLVVAGMLLLIAVIDGVYVLNINRRLRVTADIADRASRAKTQFLSSMSHDIRTPLNAVLGMTELAQSHAGDSAYVQECLRKISLSGNHLLTLINDILELSRVESGRISVNPAPFDVRELVSELESITRSQAVGRGLHLEVRIGALPEGCLMGDKLRLTQVYLNLLNNAVKYTDPGGSIRMEVEEAYIENGVMLTCTVADSGVGMTPEFQKLMYDSFARVSDSRIDKTEGTGLGLAIVKRMVELMNGTVTCRSAPGAGTTFTVRIPLMAAVMPAAAPQEAGQGQVRCGDLTGVRVLIAEDNDLNWEIISELLDDYGLQCSRAENGQACVDMLRAAPPNAYDLVLMDVQMPVLNGRDAAKELRADQREDLRTLPIVAMTADAFAEDVQMCLDAGMNGHVAKPIELEKVLAEIRLTLSRRKTDGGSHTEK